MKLSDLIKTGTQTTSFPTKTTSTTSQPLSQFIQSDYKPTNILEPLTTIKQNAQNTASSRVAPASTPSVTPTITPTVNTQTNTQTNTQPQTISKSFGEVDRSMPYERTASDIQNEIRSFMTKSNQTQDDVDRVKSLSQEYFAKQADENKFGSGFVQGATAGVAPKITETLYTPETKQAVDQAKTGTAYTLGNVAGTAALYGGAYGALGNAISGGSAISQAGGIGGATGTLSPTLSQKLGATLGTGTLGAFTGELAKDVAIGAPISAVQAATSGNDVKDEVAKNFMFDLLIGGGISGLGSAIGGLKSLRQAKTPEVVEQLAKRLDVPTSEANTIAERVIKDTPQVEVGSLINRSGGLSNTPLNVNPSSTLRQSQDSIIEPTLKAAESAQTPKLSSILEPNTATPKQLSTIDDVIVKAPNYTDVGAGERWVKDFDRITEKVFGKGTDEAKIIKEQLYNPFDASKGDYARGVTNNSDELYETIVKGYNIKPGTTESALTMRFGEGRIEYDDLVKEVGEKKATDIANASNWFRNKYDSLLDEINASRAEVGKEAIPKRSDYFRHFNEFTNEFKAISEMLQNPTNIDPKLAGISEWTKPSQKWAGIFQKRTDGTKFTEDAVGGMLDYLPAAEYAIHIDQHINNFRKFSQNLAESTQSTRNLNNYIKYLEDFSNDLAGKTNMWDRPLMERIGRNNWAIVNALNNRVKSNTVLGSVGSSLSQILNVPNGLADVKDPQIIASGFNDYVKSLNGQGHSDLYKQSDFLTERFMDGAQSKFKTKLIEQPKKMAVWMLGALDEVGSKFIWSMEYNKALKEGTKNPLKYADDQTRKMVGGRGIGEVPLWQKSKLAGLVMPFTVEVNNSLNVVKDMVKEKDMAGLAVLAGSSWLFNSTIEPLTGQRPLPDPIEAIASGIEGGDTFGDKLLQAGGSLAGEALSAVPGGQFVASIVPEYGVTTGINAPDFIKTAVPSLVGEQGTISLPGREELFGGNDPSRYMTGGAIPLVKGITNPLRYSALPFGGNQLSKTIEGAQSTGLLPQKISTDEGLKYENVPASVSNSGRIRTFTEPNPLTTAQSLAFGQYSTPNVRNYFDEQRTAYSEKQTASLLRLVESGFDAGKLDSAISQIKEQNLTKKDERLKLLRELGYNSSEVRKIGGELYGYSN